jgi:4-diphosphocytidyl-2-C-methyl-D-erythritol kinase
MSTLRYYSPAKINLFFHVLGKRLDGYHEIATLMQAIDLFDEVTISNSARDWMACSDPALPCDASNLVIKALHVFRRYYEFAPVSIHLEKRIPLQAGLGGGSSNAATMLWALNERIGSRASLSQLIAMGTELGSDVPFFFSNGSAYCTGRGDVIQPLLVPPFHGHLAFPSMSLSTAHVYQHIHYDCDIASRQIDSIALCSRFQELESLQADPEAWGHRLRALCVNDLEPAAFRIAPELRSFKQKLKFSAVSMTGSGSAFICLGAGESPVNTCLTPFKSVLRPQSDWYYGAVK